jgi:pyruvate formate lyase activating enzyme
MTNRWYGGSFLEVQAMRDVCSRTETAIDQRAAGMLFDIKRFAIHDGPGIRTTAFLKGCPLACAWCHNPESQDSDPQLLHRPNRCTGCGTCQEVCPEGAVHLEERQAITDRERCTACGACVSVCPGEARSIVGASWTAEALVSELAKDALFFEQSGGGITCSGGEPLLQPGFCAEVLRGCRERGIHTAVDTCGYADESSLLDVAKETDLFLYDLKLMDDARHRQATGVSNAPVLTNLERLDLWGKRIWIRIPLIPGVNDDERNLTATAGFVRGLRRIEAVQVLPYHRGGEEKRIGLGKTGAMCTEREPGRAAEAADRSTEFLASRIGIPVTKGG